MNTNFTSAEKVLFESQKFSFFYGDKQALTDIGLKINAARVTAIIGPSGCGKSTFLRSLNRMNDFIEDTRHAGNILFDGDNIQDLEPALLRRQVGMVFQRPNPFPKSIYKNIIWGPYINGMSFDADELVEKCLTKAALWDEVKDRLHTSALSLSGGQQQRLCVARTIAMSPQVILMDEPCSSLDPLSTAKIEALISELRGKYTIVIVTHNMQQASRISDTTCFFYNGSLIESGATSQIFTNPKNKQTEDYITGRFG